MALRIRWLRRLGRSEHDLALAMVCNRGGGTPIGDLRILRLSQAAARAIHSG